MEINIEERVAMARDNFLAGYNCCQSVVLAFKDIAGVDTEILERLSIGLGAGVGRMREVCGTVGAMALLAGTFARINPADDHRKQKSDTYAIVQLLAGKFKEKHGTIVCREILGLRAQQKMSHVPQERTEEYYRTRPCVAIVESSARIIAEYIANNY